MLNLLVQFALLISCVSSSMQYRNIDDAIYRNWKNGDLQNLMMERLFHLKRQRIEKRFIGDEYSGAWNKLQRVNNPDEFRFSPHDVRKLFAGMKEPVGLESDKVDGTPSLDGQMTSENEASLSCPKCSTCHSRIKKNYVLVCPTADPSGEWTCIDDLKICNGKKDCPNGEDELPVQCLFYNAIDAQIHVLADNFVHFHG